ncbi:hypothetical protein QN277_028345 [Acacia crassicarpa]|uniref:Uncharacterized protein n=1 Tax=Acacia crassicarpa TaxID=499986 RepID=A0AAE1MF22_9FABA|nr:hypothetical protein QN277_028345 [Acacia crassicarpa]
MRQLSHWRFTYWDSLGSCTDKTRRSLLVQFLRNWTILVKMPPKGISDAMNASYAQSNQCSNLASRNVLIHYSRVCHML